MSGWHFVRTPLPFRDWFCEVNEVTLHCLRKSIVIFQIVNLVKAVKAWVSSALWQYFFYNQWQINSINTIRQKKPQKQWVYGAQSVLCIFCTSYYIRHHVLHLHCFIFNNPCLSSHISYHICYKTLHLYKEVLFSSSINERNFSIQILRDAKFMFLPQMFWRDPF